MKEKEFWKSKKWWTMIAGVSVPVINRIFELNLEVEELQMIIGSFVAYIVGQGVADVGKNTPKTED